MMRSKLKIITFYLSLSLTPEENATHCEVLKIHIFLNFQFERNNTLIISRENRTTLCNSKTSHMSR